MGDLNLVVWLTQLGISVVAPLTVCTLGTLWIQNRFQLGSWVLILGIALGLFLAIDGARASLKIMTQISGKKKKGNEPPPVSFNDHQ